MKMYLISLPVILFTVFVCAGCSGSSQLAANDEMVLPEGEIILREADTMPEMIGGQSALYNNLTYPTEMRRRGAQGRTILTFVVDTEGKPRDIQVIRSSGHRALDNAAIAALRKTEFKPGINEGKKVYVQVTQPVIFRLN